MNRYAVAATVVLIAQLALPASVSEAASDRPLERAGLGEDAERQDSAPLDAAYRFDAEGLLSLPASGRLPVPRGVVTARWYALGGWAVVVFEGLELGETGPLCLGTSAIDRSSGLLGRVSFAPTASGACDAAGAGELPPAGPDTGVRACGEVVAFVTRIPAETDGPLIAEVLIFDGGGTGTGLSARLEAPRSLPELDRSWVDCGPRGYPRASAGP